MLYFWYNPFVQRAAVVLGVCFMGCSPYLGSAVDVEAQTLDAEPGWTLVRDVPVVLQEEEKDCGAAATAMVLQYWGLPVNRTDVLAAYPIHSDGMRAGDLRDFTRRHGLRAFLLQGEFADLAKELGKRRPVIVGMVKPYLTGALTHYEVVVGIHEERRLVVTIDPAHGWRQNTFDGFLKEWNPSNRLTLVVFRPVEK